MNSGSPFFLGGGKLQSHSRWNKQYCPTKASIQLSAAGCLYSLMATMQFGADEAPEPLSGAASAEEKLPNQEITDLWPRP